MLSKHSAGTMAPQGVGVERHTGYLNVTLTRCHFDENVTVIMELCCPGILPAPFMAKMHTSLLSTSPSNACAITAKLSQTPLTKIAGKIIAQVRLMCCYCAAPAVPPLQHCHYRCASVECCVIQHGPQEDLQRPSCQVTPQRNHCPLQDSTVLSNSGFTADSYSEEKHSKQGAEVGREPQVQHSSGK